MPLEHAYETSVRFRSLSTSVRASTAVVGQQIIMQAVAFRTQAALTAPRGRVRLVTVATANQEPSTSGRQAPQAPRAQQQQTPRPGMMMGPNGRPLIMGPEGQPVEVSTSLYAWCDDNCRALYSFDRSVRA